MNPSNFGYPGRGMPMYPMMGYRPSQPGMQGGLVTEQRDGFQEYGTFAETNGILDPLSAIAFDPCEELVWVGSQTVRYMLGEGRREPRDACILTGAGLRIDPPFPCLSGRLKT
jgi:hypothetical protein